MTPKALSPRHRLAALLALGVPVVSLILVVLLPWNAPPPFRHAGMIWLVTTVLIGTIGILLLPWRWPAKMLATMAYPPLSFLALAMGNVVLGCVVHGPHACP